MKDLCCRHLSVFAFEICMAAVMCQKKIQALSESCKEDIKFQVLQIKNESPRCCNTTFIWKGVKQTPKVTMALVGTAEA